MRKCKVVGKRDRLDNRCEVKIQEPHTKRTYCLGDAKVSDMTLLRRNIVLPKSVSEKLKVGDNIRVIKDSYHDLCDYVYLCDNGVVLVQKPRHDTKQSYKDYLLQIPGLLNWNIDKIALCFALIQECHRRNLGVSLLSWRNLQKVCQDNQNLGR